MNAQPLVALRHIAKSFGSLVVNQDICLEIFPGRIKALLGENGAGKSTLMNILAGRLQPDQGDIIMDGKPVTLASPREAIQRGVGMVYQHFMLVDAMTVSDNIFLGQMTGWRVQPEEMHAAVEKLSHQYALPVNPRSRIRNLSMGERQRVEILKLLFRDSRLLILDEPTAVLTPQEVDQLFQALRSMADQGKAIIFISHKLTEVMALADEVAVMRKGKIVCDLAASAVASQTELAQRMVGQEEMPDPIQREPVDARQIVLQIDHLRHPPLDQLHLQLRQGEILGLVGVAGNGQKALVEIICGLTRPVDGDVAIMGEPWEDFYRQPQQDNRVSYIPEDRLGMASCGQMNLVDNFLITTRFSFSRGQWLQHALSQEKTRDAIDTFQITPPNPRAAARYLSGGNLQKLVIAREFFRRPRLIVAEQPTQGLDIRATHDVWSLLLKARERAGILLVTGDLTEAFTLADRIAVIYNGRLMVVFDSDDTEKREQLGVFMAGMQPSKPSAPEIPS